MIDGLIRAFAPQWALRREQARRALAYYEAARPNPQRKQRRERNSANTANRAAGSSIREQARHLEQNHDLAKSILRVLVNNTVGAHGILVEPTPLLPDGTLDEGFARAALALWDEWGESPDVTGRHTWPAIQRLLARTKYRDGEAFLRLVPGTSGRIPLALELMEPDYFPIGYDSDANGVRVRDAIELDRWGKAIAYWATKGHPGEHDTSFRDAQSFVRVAADEMLHLAVRERIHQRRGMSLFAAILGRLDDLKDYEKSESIAAKVAASLGAAIKKGAPEFYSIEQNEDGDVPRDMKFKPGMIFDDLLPGESIEMIGTGGRPNSQLTEFRNSMLNAATSGVGVSSSSVTRNYDGSYSARRQELVDAWVDYAVLAQDLAAELVRPVYRRVVQLGVATGELKLPRGMELRAAMQAMYVTPQMPWIDPLKEQQAWFGLEQSGHASGPEIIRRRGRSPGDVLREELAWRELWRSTDGRAPTDQLQTAGQVTSEPPPVGVHRAELRVG